MRNTRIWCSCNLVWICLLVTLTGQAHAQQTTNAGAQPVKAVRVIRIPDVQNGTSPIYDYVTTLLAEALATNRDQYGDFRLVPNTDVTVQERQLRNLEHNLLDVTWSVTSTDREKYHRVVRIPLVAGLFGQRLFIVRKNDKRFDHPLTPSELKHMKMVQGQDWPDTRIFRHHGYSVLEATYQSAFRMVSEGFVDYFPRGVLEVNFELAAHQDEPLALEQHTVVSYPSAMFFFVAQGNERLAQRIEEGLNNLVENGDFQALLEKQAFYQQAKNQIEQRTVIRLENPLLSAESEKAIAHYMPLITQSNDKDN